MMRKILIGILSILSISVFGQDYTYKADIEKIYENGFYKIALSPEISAKLNNQFFDIRLYDSTNTEVPYILQKEHRIKEKELFVRYKITEVKHFKNNNYTRLVIHNPNKTEINNIVLRVKNADVRKNLKLNGSYDNKNWYVLKDNYYYNSILNSESSSEIRILNFPLSDYTYYELLIDDYYDKPINIAEAGYYNMLIENGKYTVLEGISYTVVDSLDETIITIATQGNYIDKIAFDIDSPKYYYREAEIFVKRTKSIKNKSRDYNERLSYFRLISNSSNSFALDNLKEDTIYTRIKNNDNASLQIKSINTYQLNKYITAELNTAHSYHLKYSDRNAVKPNYDLKYFTDSIPDNLKVINTQSPQKIAKQEGVSESGNLNLNSYWLWISIIVVAGLLSYMSFKMVKDTKGKND